VIEIHYPAYVVRLPSGNFHRRGQYGDDDSTPYMENASVFVNVETAQEKATKHHGTVCAYQPDRKQLSLL
jgi:hypothetical protein